MLKCEKVVQNPVRKSVGKMWEKLWKIISFEKGGEFCTGFSAWWSVIVESFAGGFTHDVTSRKMEILHSFHIAYYYYY